MQAGNDLLLKAAYTSGRFLADLHSLQDLRPLFSFRAVKFPLNARQLRGTVERVNFEQQQGNWDI